MMFMKHNVFNTLKRITVYNITLIFLIQINGGALRNSYGGVLHGQSSRYCLILYSETV